jgi:lipoprotein-anchoring transpeptidase ErfK/SrfK
MARGYRFIAGVLGLCLIGGAAMAAEGNQVAMLEPLSLLPEIQAEPAAQAASHAGRPIVAAPGNFAAGTIIVINAERKLYLSLGQGQALVYPVAIGKPGRAYSGTTRITRMVKNPGWTPTPNIRREHPDLPDYVPPGPNNPLGPRAMHLGDGYYRIHGTNKPQSIGHEASNGCIRMLNKDVVHLFALVETGAAVIIR